jgi:hypothetical protein
MSAQDAVARGFSEDYEIVRLVESRALSWIKERKQLFNPLYHTNIRQIKMAIKASAELAMVCALARDNNHRSNPFGYRELMLFLWHEVFQQEALQEYLLDNPNGLPTFGMYASFRRSGFEDESYRSRLKWILSQGYMQAVEAPASAHMDFLYSLIVGDLSVDEAKMRLDEMYTRSLLAQHPPLLPLTKSDSYAITHTLFFLTDFGRRSLHRFSDQDAGYFGQALPRLLDFYVRRQNWDLSAELLIGMFVTDLCKLPAYRNGWHLLLSAQNVDGSFTGPDLEEVRGPEPATLVGTPSEEEAGWTLFSENYHTTLAVLMALQTCRLDSASSSLRA